MTSAQWCYRHNNIIFLVIILILKHVLVRLMQKYLILVINCLLCCMNWYSWGVIRSSHRIRTRSHCIRIVVKFYNHTYSYSCKILQPYVAAPVQTHSDAVLSSTGAPLMKTVIKIIVSNKMVHFHFVRIWLPDTCESAFRDSILMCICNTVKTIE